MAGEPKNRKKSFIFNVEWQEILIAYPGEVRLEVYDAIIEYVASGTLPELNPMSKMAFSFIKKEIDYNTEKYNEIVEKRREAGKKGMASRYQKVTNLTSVTSDNKANKTNTCQQEVTNVTDNDIIYNDNIIKETSTKVEEKKTAATAATQTKNKAATLERNKAATLARKEKFYESLIPYLKTYPKSMVREFFNHWSEMNKSCTKMKWEQERTWELNLRLANWAKREKQYAYGNNRSTSKDEANEYAMQKLAERIEQREQGVSSEVQEPW